MNQYAFIITGGGAAGLSMAYHLLRSPLQDKRILIIDRVEKNKNDRTWCFWEKDPGPFEEILYHSWNELWFYSQGFERLMPIRPYTYKMIRGLDFYQFVEQAIHAAPNVDRALGQVVRIENLVDSVVVTTNEATYSGKWCFNSILFSPINKVDSHYLDQHFKGWVIRTESPHFDPNRATLMDFRIPQKGEVRFIYVLPVDANTALVELAIFSKQLLAPQEYDEILQNYIGAYLRPGGYEVRHTEFGIIPMTDFQFKPYDGRVVHIGSAGGNTKASTGYTFWRIQQSLGRIIESLLRDGHPYVKEKDRVKQRFSWLDRIFLSVLENKELPGDKLFSELFAKNPPQRILSFLNEESGLSQELRIMAALPFFPFFKAMSRELLRSVPEARSNLPVISG